MDQDRPSEDPEPPDGERRQSQGQFPTADDAPLVTEEGVNEATADLVEEAPEAPESRPSSPSGDE